MMKELTPAVMQEAVFLIEQLRSSRLNEEQISASVERLAELLPDPYFIDYTVDQVPELSPEDVVKKAFAYRPIQL